MFDNFSESSIKVVMLAQEQARRLKQHSLRAELLLIAIVLEHRSIAAKAITAIGVDRDRVQFEIEKLSEPGKEDCPVEIPFTPATLLLFEKAAEKSKELGDSHLNPEHLLLAILENRADYALVVIRNCGMDPKLLAAEVLRQRDNQSELQESESAWNLQQGDIVTVVHRDSFQPNANNEALPMVVMTSNQFLSKMNSITLVPISQNANNDLDIAITASSLEGKQANLANDSYIACAFVCSYPRKWIIEKRGKLPKDLVSEICNKLAELTKMID